MLKKKSFPLSVRQFSQLSEKNALNFDIAIQRKGNMWDVHRKSLFINSLIYGYPIPPIYTKTDEDNEVYSFIDGKQRITCILSFVSDEFALSPKTPDIDGVEIAGCKFSELSDEFQNIILKSTFSVVRFECISDEEIEQMFFRLNNGVALKPIESTRVLLGTDNMKLVEKIANHEFLSKKSSISKNRYTDQESALHLLMLTKNQLTGLSTGFSSKELREFVQSYKKNPFEPDLIEIVENRLDFLNEAFDKKRKYIKKIHLPMIYHLVQKAINTGISPQYFAIWADEFFKDLDKESLYSQACQSGSAKRENVVIRIAEIERAFDNSFKAYEHREVVTS